MPRNVWRYMIDLSRSFRLLGLLLFGLVFLLSRPPTAAAHPLGNFSINTYSRLQATPSEIDLLYIVDMAEIPAFQEYELIDANGDERLSEREQEQYLNDTVGRLQSKLTLTIDGRPLELVLREKSLEFPAGQGGLNTQRLTLHFTAALSAQAWPATAAFHDGNYPSRVGWHEIVVQAADDATLLDSDVPNQSISQELRQYPEDLLQNPLVVQQATFRFTAGGQSEEPTAAGPAAPADRGWLARQSSLGRDGFANLITDPILGPGALVLTLLVAFGWGAAHAFTPGHGKTIVAAYLVGSRGTARHALFLGLTTTITHTLGVFILGFVVLFASQFILPELFYPWLGVLSGGLVVVVGLSLLSQRARQLRNARTVAHRHNHNYPDHHHHHHEHTHDHEHDHVHGEHDHLHGEVGHTHFPSGDSPVNWRSLLALGVSGGLVPCPSALVMMLGAIALERTAWGLVLILAFSIGLAGVLTAIGVLMVYAQRFFAMIPAGSRRKGLLRAVPVLSAVLIVMAGLGITIGALVETGVLK
jgi:nickel/cobalt transporter (NicO) family protein